MIKWLVFFAFLVFKYLWIKGDWLGYKINLVNDGVNYN